MKKIIAAVVTALVAVALVVVGVAAPASAHTATLSGSAACTTGTGAAVVTWTIVNDYNEVVTVTASDNAAIPANTTTLPATGGGAATVKTFTQNIPAPAAGVTVEATLSFEWSVDNFKQTDTKATATVSGGCVAPTPKDAGATLTDTPASCTSAETVSEGTATNASWDGAIVYSGINNTSYTASATAAANHQFPDAANVTNSGSVKTFSGVLAPKVTAGCDTPPPCISNSHVTYTYSHSDANQGVITVNDVDGSSHVLCNPFYVTATSWTFTNHTSVWPQNVDVVDQLGKINAPGTYPYAALVTCGQGDIYASTDANAPSLNPAHYPQHTGQLLGSGNPFAEHFLSQMGFTQTGSTGDTWIVDNNSCWHGTPETGSPTSSVASCTPGSANSLTLPAVLGGVWTVSNTGYTHSYPIGTGVNGILPPNGFHPNDYTITLTDGSNTDAYDVTSPATPWSWAPIDTNGLDCHVYKPTVSVEVGVCSALNGVSSETVTLVFDNTQSTGSSEFVVPAENVDEVVDAGLIRKVQVTSVNTTGGSFDVFINGAATAVTINVPAFTGCVTEIPGDPLVTQLVCQNGVPTGGSILVDLNSNLVYTITGPTESTTPTVWSPVTGAVTPLASGHYIVSVVAKPGFVLTGPSVWIEGVDSWTLTKQIDDLTCTTTNVSASATPTPATCSASATNPVEVDGQITITPNDDIIYQINGGDRVTQTTTSVADGEYVVTAKLTDAAKLKGDILTGQSSWTFDFGPVLCVPTLAAWPASATGTPATCTHGTASGVITLGRLNPGKVYYLVENDATKTVIRTGSRVASIIVPPGSYTVTAKPVKKTDGISGKSVFDVAIASPTKICGNTTTLAFTGSTIGTLGFLIAGGMMFLGAAAIYMRRRFGRAAE